MLESENEALVGPRIPFMQMRRVQVPSGTHIITNQIKNVSIDLQETVRLPPRNLDEDHASTYV